MTNAKRPHVFLCHASEDKPAVRKYYKRLKKDGVDAWFDEEELLPGQDWQLEIYKAVKASEVVIVFLSSQSVRKAGFVQKEIRQALDVAKEKPEGTIYFIPAKLDGCVVPDSLINFQWVNLYDDKGYERLKKALKTRIDLPEKTHPVPSDKDTIEMSKLAQVTIVIEKDILKFTEKEKENFVFAISDLTGVSSSQIRILHVAEGSTIITLEMPEIGVRRLLELYDKDNVEIEKLGIRKINLNVLGVLDNLIGLDEVKKFIRLQVSRIEMEKRLNKNISEIPPILGAMVFAGNPGTGKTTVARLLGQILMELGYLKNEHLLITTSADFIGMYIGQTSIKTREVVERALDGVLFIDEAYMLSSNIFGQEALTEMMTLMELYKNRILFIFSGYQNEMNKFLEQNPGLSHRLAHVIDFPDYSAKELLDILESMASQHGFDLLSTSKEKAKKYLVNAKVKQNPYFGNAFEARKLLEMMEARCAERVFRDNIEIETRPNILPDDVPEFSP